MKRTLLSTVAVPAVLIALTACQAPPPNRGRAGARMEPTHDAPGEVGTRSPRTPDLIEATDRMAEDIARRLDVNDPSQPPIIVVGEIENRSSCPQRELQIFLVRLRTQLQSSGARRGLEFVRERAFVEHQRDRQYAGHDPAATGATYAPRADYVLTCELYDFPSGGTIYYLFDYQLVQLRDADSGPDLGPGAIVWENKYEVKFQ